MIKFTIDFLSGFTRFSIHHKYTDFTFLGSENDAGKAL